MTMQARKLAGIATISAVVLLANARTIAARLHDIGVILWARSVRA